MLLAQGSDLAGIPQAILGEGPDRLEHPQVAVGFEGEERAVHQPRAEVAHRLLGHAVVGDDFPAIPAWLDEGLGELYESATVDAAGVHLGRGEGGGQLRAALRRGELPTLTQLATTADDELRGPRAPLLYALGAAVLRHVDQAGHLGDLYATIRANPRDPERHVAALRQYVDEDALRRLVAGL